VERAGKKSFKKTMIDPSGFAYTHKFMMKQKSFDFLNVTVVTFCYRLLFETW